MAYSNNMTKLVGKIERRLGVSQLNLPPRLQKDKWPQVIDEDTLDTFSRYIPHKFPIILDSSDKKGDHYIIDEDKIPGDLQILGVRDIRWDEFGGSSAAASQSFGVYDFFANNYDMGDMMLVQMKADQVSLFNNGLFLEFEAPNKVRLKNAAGANAAGAVPYFKIDVFLKHPNNLATIAPTKMEIFEKLAISDVASFLYQELKHYDGLETVYANIDLKLQDLQDWASKREAIEQELKESYVSAGNDNQPIMYTVG